MSLEHIFLPTFLKMLTRLTDHGQTINVASRQLRKNTSARGGHVFQATETIFELVKDNIRTNLLTKLHEDRRINVASKVLTRFYYSHNYNDKFLPPPGGLFNEDWTINMTKNRTNLLTKFHDDRTINVASKVKNSPPPCGYVFKPTETNVKFVQDIIGTNSHEDRTIHVGSKEHFLISFL
ncbi:hypothetical protein DPMN_031031 [Dreissena polymorpha]|uniref:Uncharacterized protein n=1 Tax=Dreissena polymorpha TaxID=45954 RepID=A0A9D4M201_DREPO|nr:hypothetical protein DPMN_031031 [Dreissena polymorpha]